MQGAKWQTQMLPVLMIRLTLKNGCLGVVDGRPQEIGIFGGDDGELGAPSKHRPLPVPKLVQVLADMPQICSTQTRNHVNTAHSLLNHVLATRNVLWEKNGAAIFQAGIAHCYCTVM